jgi:hypothetical protein
MGKMTGEGIIDIPGRKRGLARGWRELYTGELEKYLERWPSWLKATAC